MKTITTRINGRLRIDVGSITEFDGDAIVNAANSGLLGGGGVDGAIHTAAGPELLRECREIRAKTLQDGLPAGKAVVTGSGRLKTRVIIHTVGPVWHGGSQGESELLSSCYRESLSLARDNELHSVAFPAISTGVYGYPKDKAARIAFSAIKAFLDQNHIPELVVLVFYSEADAKVFLSAI